MLKYTVETVGLVLIVFLLFIGSLFFREQHLPRFVVSRIERRLSTDELRVRVDRMAFGFRHGLRLQGVRLYDMRRENWLEDPIGRAQVVTFDYWRQAVTVVGAEYRRLPDSYYRARQDEPEEESRPITLPDLEPLQVRLEHPIILGVCPDAVTLRLVVGKRRIALEDIHVAMPDRDRRLHIDGHLEIDFAAQKVTGQAEGLVGYSQIAPVIEVLDEPIAIPYVEAFSGISDPIPAASSWVGDMKAGSLDLRFFLDVPRCRYQGVLVTGVKGSIRIGYRPEGKGAAYGVDIVVDEATDSDGRRLAGKLSVDNADGPDRLRFDAKSTLRFEDLLDIIHVFSPQTFSPFVCDAPPELAVRGSCGTRAEDLDGNDLEGHVFVRHGSVIGLKVNDLRSDFTFRRNVFEAHSEATGKTGGRFKWHDRLTLEDFDAERTRFSVDATCRSASLEELADLLAFDLGERRGTVEGEVSLSGLAGTNLFHTLNGKGKVGIADGKLAQMKLFAGLTAILAETVPGVSYLVNQSQASSDFTIENGVFRSENVMVEGGLISISGRGSYDIVKDDLDFTVRVRLFKKDSLVGKVIHPLTSPLAWMLMEFRLTGPMDNPSWRRITLTDRIF